MKSKTYFGTRFQRNSSKSESGSGLLEATIVIPVLLMVVFGIIQMGYLLASYITIRNASASAARVGIVNADKATTDRSAFDTLINNAVNASLVPLDTSRATIPAAVVDNANPARVSVTVNYSLPLFPGAEFVLGHGGNFAMTATTTMR